MLMRDLGEFYSKLCRDAAKLEDPSKLLTREKIVEQFLAFADKVDSDGGRERILANQKASELTIEEFIFERYLFLSRDAQANVEFLRLKSEVNECNKLLKEKVIAYKKQGNLKQGKETKEDYICREICGQLNKSKHTYSTRKLICAALQNCSTTRNSQWFLSPNYQRERFSLDLLESDQGNFVFFDIFNDQEYRRIMKLKATNHDAYTDAFEKMIYEKGIPK